MVVDPGKVLHTLGLCCHIFDACCQAVVHVGKEVVALVPSHLGNVDGQTECHGRVPGVATALVHLSELSIGSGFQFRVGNCHHKIAQELGESVVLDGIIGARVAECSHLIVFKIRHTLVVDEHIVAENANADDAERIAQSPVAPVVAGGLPPLATVLPGSVAMAQESDGLGVPKVEHPSFELFEIGGRPTFVVAHQLGCLRKLITIESHGKALVGVAGNVLGGVGPCHENAHGIVGTGGVSLNFPAQRILVGHGCSAGCIDVVFARAAPAHNGFHR